MSKILFQGTQESIEKINPEPGGLYFALDTRKIYLAVPTDEEDDRFEGVDMKEILEMDQSMTLTEDGDILDQEGNKLV